MRSACMGKTWKDHPQVRLQRKRKERNTFSDDVEWAAEEYGWTMEP